MKILVIEDDIETGAYVKGGLEEQGHVVDLAANGRDGLFLAAGETYDIMIIDRMLPGLDGLGIVKTVRGAGIKTPIIFLTTMVGVGDRVEGLEAGGDDYLVKRGVLKEFPVLGPDSVEASRVAVAAKLQLPPDKMRMFHDKLMETRGRASGDQAFALAKELGADVAKLQKDIQAGAISTVLHENAALADKLGITGTSTFILNEDIIAGAGGLEPAPSRREHATLRQSSVRVIEQAANAHSIGEPS